MLEIEVKETLSDIETITMSTIAPFIANTFNGGTVQYGYKQFEAHDRNTTYLMFSHKNRVLFYGVDTPKQQYAFPMLSGELDFDEVQTSFDPCIFARKGILKQSDVKDIFYAESDSEIEILESVEPTDEETDEDFFLRNALWLLNPVVH